MRLAVSPDGRKIDAAKIVSTPSDFKIGMAQFKRVAGELLGGTKPEAIAGGIAGPLNLAKTKVIGAPHLPLWQNQPLAATLKRLTRGKVFIENDPPLAGLGEALSGAGQGYKIVAYYTVSTGVGGARIVDGKIDAHSFGFEPGHQIIGLESNGHGGNIRPIFLESRVSGSGLTQRFQKTPELITDKAVWAEAGRWLAYGLYNTLVHWSPEVIVLGGGLIEHEAIDLKIVRSELQKLNHIFPAVPPVMRARLGGLAGLHGALQYLRQEL